MRVSIITADNSIFVDGKPRQVNCGQLVLDRIRALQWYGSEGELEYVNHERPNEKIVDFSPYQMYVDTAEDIPEPRPMTLEEHLHFHEEYVKRHPHIVSKPLPMKETKAPKKRR